VNDLAKRALIAGGIGLAACYATKAYLRHRRWFDFAGKVVVVTGGSRGLGLVIARQLTAEGANVAICARTEEDVESAVAELRERGGSAIGMACDVRKPAEVRTMIGEVHRHWGRIDVLMNVAGIIEVGPLEAMTLADFHDAMDSNCWGALHTTLAALPIMKRQRFGRIVNVASIGGKRAVPHMLPYDVSKFALVGLSTGLRAELAKDGILVTTACPTLMRTGSPRNALFKGQHRLEYLWFSLGGSLPLVSMDAERAAGQILWACQAGEGEVWIGNPLNPAMLASRLLPGLTSEALAIVARFLPPRGGIGQASARGYESESALSPSWLTALGDQAARENNELRPRPATH
jgi:NAD(P)-dependent dehydrogenase (short-subunit alcohol dehydrogenase family)